MPTNRKWLILPPAVALLLVLGPMSMRSEPARAQTRDSSQQPRELQDPRADRQQEPPAERAGAPSTNGARTERSPVPALPRTPDLMQVGSTLIGVLLLGGIGLMLLRRLRQGPSSTANGAISLRHSLRLSPKQVVHALEFDGRLLLVGEGERGLQLLHAAAVGGELAAAEPAPTPPGDDDDGAVPKNLVLPRPAGPTGKDPRRVAAAGRTTARTAGSATPPAARKATLGDFRALLAKAGR